MKIISLITLTLFGIACFNIKKQSHFLPIEIFNKSNFNVDTFYFILNNYERYVFDIKKGDSILFNIDKDSIKTYRDLSLDCWAIFHISTDMRLLKRQVHHDDIGGTIDEKYTITFKKDTSIDISPQFKYISH